jgi:predicted outer membrane protein
MYDIYGDNEHYNKNIKDTIQGIKLDINYKAYINDQEKVTLAKIKGTLPKSYGKSVRELMIENRP